MSRTLRRRRFLELSLAAGASAASPLRAPAQAPTADPRDADSPGPVLVVVFLRGGADGLSMVVPHADPRYRELRKATLLAPPGGGPAAVLDLDGQFGLHPALAPLEPLYRRGVLSWIHAIGSPSRTRSHFEAQDYMELGTPDVVTTGAGWLARYLDQLGGALPLFGAISTSPNLPLGLWPNVEALTLEGGEPDTSQRGGERYREALASGRRALFRGSSPLARSARRHLEAAEYLQGVPRNGPSRGYPKGALGSDLSLIASLIKRRVGLRVAWVDSTGWDTHLRQGAEVGTLAGQLHDLGGSLAAFARDLGDELQRVVVVGLTEFGRTAAENATGGTDHGHGSVMFALGGPVAGGRVLGSWPGLSPERLYAGRDLAVTTDFRQPLLELLQRHMQCPDPGALFPGFESAGTPLAILRG